MLEAEREAAYRKGRVVVLIGCQFGFNTLRLSRCLPLSSVTVWLFAAQLVALPEATQEDGEEGEDKPAAGEEQGKSGGGALLTVSIVECVVMTQKSRSDWLAENGLLPLLHFTSVRDGVIRHLALTSFFLVIWFIFFLALARKRSHWWK